MSDNGYWYLATPYSKWTNGIEDAYREACIQTAILIEAKVPVYSPIAHTHGVAIHGDIDPLDHSVWMPADMPMMHCAKGLIVCMMDGWHSSYGIDMEIKEFIKEHKPIIYMTQDEVPNELINKA